MSEWTRVVPRVSHVHVSSHLCMVAEPSCVQRRWIVLESWHVGYVGRATGTVVSCTAASWNCAAGDKLQDIATLEIAPNTPGAGTATSTTVATVPSTSMVDIRVLGKPSNFAGDEALWKSWSFVMLSFSAAVSPELRALMEKSRVAVTGVRNVNLTAAEQVWRRQLHCSLSLSTSGEV